MGFTDEYVKRCLKASAKASATKKEKVIKDSVWGMVEVDSASSRLFDSPIIQRLRNVKQLGFTYFTYPSAEHSRFIHTLGMYAVVRRFIESMKRRENEPVSDFSRFRVNEQLEKDLLHAAILHDCGHMPFSHATEKACVFYDKDFFCGPITVRDFLFDASEALSKNLNLSECLSLAIVLSPRFDEYYGRYVRIGEDPEAISRIGALIAGHTPMEGLTGPAQLISSSSVDADKIDYINRDALACGIPVGIDVARLFLRSAFVNVPGNNLKELYAKKEVPPDEVVFVVNSSGMDTIEELAHARASLYQRVYLHQTTRNAERLLARCLESLPQKRLDKPEPLRDVLTLLSIDDSSLVRQLADYEQEPVVSELGTRLRNRDLLKRACVFSRTLADMVMNPKDVFDAMPQDKINAITRETLGMSLQTLLSPSKPSSPSGLGGIALAAFERKISQEAKDIATIVRGLRPKLVPEDEEEPSIVTVLPMTELPGLNKDCLVLENTRLTHSSSRSITDEQSDAADIYKSLGYVMTDLHWREIVCLATRKVVETTTREIRRPTTIEYGASEDLKTGAFVEGRTIINYEGVIRRAGLAWGPISDLQSTLEDAGYYDEVPYLAPCKSEHAQHISSKVRGFVGQGRWQPSSAHCKAFVSQFPPKFRPLLNAAFSQHFQLLQPDTAAAYLVGALNTLRATSGPSTRLLVTGFTPDSGNMIRMFFDHYTHGSISDVKVCKDISEVLTAATQDDIVVLCDDNIGSGTQAQAQFRAWMGIPLAEWPIDQQREGGIYKEPLTLAERERLKNTRFGLAMCVGKQSAGGGLGQLAKSLGLSKFVGLHLGEKLDSRPKTSLDAGLCEFLRNVGADILAHHRYSSPFAKLDVALQSECLADGAGYGDSQWFLATPYNVPTSTFTALWHPGVYHDRPWFPLLMRRGHLKDLIIT